MISTKVALLFGINCSHKQVSSLGSNLFRCEGDVRILELVRGFLPGMIGLDCKDPIS